MKKFSKILCLVLAIAVIFTAVAAVAVVMLKKDAPDNNGDEVVGLTPLDAVKPMDYTSLSSFFEDNSFEEDKDEWSSINPYYDAYPKSDNTSNFHSHATATYENINGRTVTVDTLYRNYKEALNDPNFSCGLLIYQCIQYKIAHPEEHVEISYSAFRISPTLAVCINPNSPYYGYVRALYEGDYDENGFVRVAYLLVEAAKMGIDVNLVGQLPSYGTTQYDPETGKTYTKQEPSYTSYFNAAMKYACYDEYAKGDTVADHFTLRKVMWNYDDNSATDVMHVKTCAVSAYRDKYGVDHEYGVWFSSTNLDTANYRGFNANGGSQSGVIITNHEDIYVATKNYVALMGEYYEQTDLFEFRRLVRERVEEQVEAALEGRYYEIPTDERIVYVGSETDDVFELYFTPLSGDVDTWDTTLNPYCKYMQKFHDSDDEDVVFCFNNPNFTESFVVADLLVDVLEEKFINNKRLGNRLGIRCKYGVFEGFKELKAGKDLGFINFKTTHDNVHEKDIIMSYVENGERQYVTLISSCNFNEGALYYQTNHLIVIKETEATDNVVYTSLGSKFSKGAIVDDGEGIDFSADERLIMSEKLASLPLTFEATIKLDPATETVKNYGTLFSNNDLWNYSVLYWTSADGNPRVSFSFLDDSTGMTSYQRSTYTFDQVVLCTGEKLHLAIVTDPEARTVSCYINGKLMQTLNMISTLDMTIDRVSARPFVVGGDYVGSNAAHFKGTIYDLSVWSDIRTAAEITADVSGVKSLTDTALMAHYEFYGRTPNTFGGDMSSYDNDLVTEQLWMEEDSLLDVPEDYYAFAVVGDTQALSLAYPENLAHLYDWLAENKESKGIEYVIGVGDITENATQEEYDFAWAQIQKLSGKIPYSLIMGNHDKYDYKEQGYMPENMSDFLFNKTFYNDTYLSELDGWYGEGDVSCSYNAITVGETKWLILNLDFGPTDEMLTWAGEVIEAHADHKVIVVTHAYLYRDGTTLDAGECYAASDHNEVFNDGDQIFDKLIRKYENIELVLCGHDPWDHIVCSQVKGDKGNTVTQLLINPQYVDSKYGAAEMVALLYFSPDGSELIVRYYSAALEKYGSVKSQFTVTLD